MTSTSPTRSASRCRLLAGAVAVSGVVALSLVAGVGGAAAQARTAQPSHGVAPVPAALSVGPVSVVPLLSDTKGNGDDKGDKGDDRGIKGNNGQRSFGVQPSGPKAPDARPSLTYRDVRPGQRLFDRVAIINISNQPVTLSLYAADAFNTDDGGFDVLRQNQRSKDVATWVKLRRNQVTVPARSSFITPIELTVPKNVEPGDHAGAIVASLRTYVKDRKGNIVAQDARTGTRLYVRVVGTLRPGLRLERHVAAFSPSILRGRAEVTYTLKNTGNVRLGGKQSLRVSGLFGITATADKLPALPELLPGNDITFTEPVDGVLPTFFDSAHITIDPESASGNVDPALAQVSATSRFTGYSWSTITVLTGALAFTVGAVVMRRRRRRTPSGPTWGGDDGSPPALPGGGGAGGGDLTVRPHAGIARRVGRLVVPGVLGVLGGLLVLVPAAGPAAAADGSLTFLPGKGSAATPIYAVTSGGCPAKGTNIVGFMYGSGLPKDGAVVMANQDAPVRHDGSFGFGLRDNLKSIAAEVGATLKGPYRITVKCIDSLNLTTYSQFTGTVTFATSDSFTAPVPAKPPLAGVPPGYLALVFPEFKKVVAADAAGAEADNQDALAAKGSPAPSARAGSGPAAAAAPAARPQTAGGTHSALKELGWSPVLVVVALVMLAGVLWLWTRRPAPVRSDGTAAIVWPDRDASPRSDGRTGTRR